MIEMELHHSRMQEQEWRMVTIPAGVQSKSAKWGEERFLSISSGENEMSVIDHHTCSLAIKLNVSGREMICQCRGIVKQV